MKLLLKRPADFNSKSEQQLDNKSLSLKDVLGVETGVESM